MVDMNVVRERLAKGAYVGAGAFGASFVEALIEDNAPVGDFGTAFGQLAVGLGISVGSDEIFTAPQSVPNDLVEYAGYGVQGAAWSNLATSVQTGEAMGSDMVRIDSNNSSRQTGQQATQVEDTSAAEQENREFSLDTA